MKPNLGMVDRDIRVALGLAICSIGLYNSSWWALVVLLPLGTAFVGWCPPYTPFGIAAYKAGTEES
jgi:hypothetical protein